MLRDINRALSSAMDAVSDKLDESLARSRITVIGQVDVQGVIKQIFLLLTYILANDNVQTLKPTLTAIRHKQCLRR